MTKKRFDGRTTAAKTLKNYYMKFNGASGGKNQELCRIAAGLALRLDLENEAAARGEAGDNDAYTRLCNSLGRTLGALGLADWLTGPKDEKPDPMKTLQDHISKKEPHANDN